ncbi:MAG: hypothetical protein ACI85F_001004 [Bacteroidia bacterium]|jgi:hypothetical protein
MLHAVKSLINCQGLSQFGAFGITVIAFVVGSENVVAQPVPPDDSNIPFLVTFGNSASHEWGDDDFSQTFFLSVPKDLASPFYIRVFDPDVGGENDELNESPDTKTKFSVYGGVGCFSDKDATGTQPTGNYKSGTLIDAKSFGADEKYDNQWFSFGPFSADQGEFISQFDNRVFKLVADGIEGNDGNLYRYFFSTSPTANIPIEGANAFNYEWTFRMPNDPGAVCHLYPYVDNKVVSVKQFNYDWDNDGVIKIISYEKKGEWVAMSSESDWKDSTHEILETERNGSLDIQFVRSKANPKKDNNVCFSIENQYGEYLQFYTIPIGGVPKFKYDVHLLDRIQEGERFNQDKVFK